MVGGGGAADGAGVVDQDVDGAVACGEVVGEGCGGGGVGEVGADGFEGASGGGDVFFDLAAGGFEVGADADDAFLKKCERLVI